MKLFGIPIWLNLSSVLVFPKSSIIIETLKVKNLTFEALFNENFQDSLEFNFFLLTY